MKIIKMKGFTLLELMITVAIIGILATVSYALYTSKIREARRTDATETLASISLAEERYRTSNATYGTVAQVWNNVTTSPGGYYTIGISNITSTGYTVTGTAVGAQASDSQSGTSCGSIVLTISNGTVTKSPAACWPQ